MTEVLMTEKGKGKGTPIMFGTCEATFKPIGTISDDQETKMDPFEDSPWNRERFRRMDEALTKLDKELNNIIGRMVEAQAVVDELYKIEDWNARRALSRMTASEIGEIIYTLHELQEVINMGMTVPEAYQETEK